MNDSVKWITSPNFIDGVAQTFKKNFNIRKEVESATLYASAIGIYVPYLNGKKVGESVLEPGFLSFRYRSLYQTYDITEEIEKENTIEFDLGNGWGAGHLDTIREKICPYTSLIAWVDICYKDGTGETVSTGADWDVFTSEVTFTSIYDGETIDKTAPIDFVGKAVISDVSAKLYPMSGEFIVENERIAPKEIIKTPSGETVIDFGQNMAGYVEVKACGKRGEKIVLDFGEVLDQQGNFYRDNYRRSKNLVTYVLSGKEDVFKPKFSFQGFRYVRLTEYPFDTVNPENFRAVVVHSDMKRTGSFKCGNEKVNQLYHNIIWGQKSNFLDVPTDCPQRDERLGWTGDAQIFCKTAAINFDVYKFFRKWLEDVALEQGENGEINGIVPDCRFKYPALTSCGWGDACCIIPWEMYVVYGNSEILKNSFDMMKKWVDYIHNYGPSEFLWLGGVHYADWLAMDLGGETLGGATSNDLIATAFFAYSTELLVKAGEVLGKDMSEYKILYKNILKAFREYFMENGIPKEELPYTEIITNPDGRALDNVRKGITQTSLTLILKFNLCTEEERPHLAELLAKLVSDNDNKLLTGFLGTPYLLHALSENGYTDLAYKLLMQEENPSWLYSVNKGATTMWEHWNGIKEDGSFWSKSMNSYNHYAYGAVFDWIFGVACGIKPEESAPGYKEVKISPNPDKCLGWIDAGIESVSGKINVHWYYKGNTVYYEFDIPEGVKAYITLPSGYSTVLNGGKYHFAE